MKTSLKAALLLLLAFMLFTVCQCSRRSDNEGKVTICFAFQDLETEFWVAAHKAITETLRAKGIHCRHAPVVMAPSGIRLAK